MNDNFERPALSCYPCSEKLPIILSSQEIKPIIQVPSSIAQYLRDYQRDGVRFLYQRFRDGEGGILADDMGLGKTIQAIAFIAAVLQMKGTREDMLRHCSDYIRLDSAPGLEVPSLSPVLIVCPASLVENWCDELTTWAYFEVFKMNGHHRKDLIRRARLCQCDVLVVSFETARTSIDYLNTVDWTCVFVDEVHRIKDGNTKLSKALNSLTCRLRYGLTGTPFQNNLKEVFCLLRWSNPHSLDDHDPNLISRLMEKGCRSSATKRDTTNSFRARRRFRDLLKRLVLRRTKEILVKHLPSKTDQVLFCKPTTIQKNIYRMITQFPEVQKFINGRPSLTGREQNHQIFSYLSILQKTANHVGLLAFGSPKETNQISQDICSQTLNLLPELQNVPQTMWKDILSDHKMSGKMLVLSNLLPEFLEQKDKILIFSYSTKLLDLIQKHIVKEGFTYCRLDGSTPADARCAMVRSYNTSPDPGIFLISTKAGGVGLNITGANVVIIFDPSWNPASDLQAQDRAYRLGQKRDVRVYRLLTTSTIEELVYLRQVYKQQLSSCSMTDINVRRYFDSIQGDPKFYGELFGVRNLFSFRESDRSLTEELLEKQQKREEKLLQKVTGKSGEEIPNAFISECPLVKNSEGYACKKSGLSDLCEEVFGANNFDEFFETSMREDRLENEDSYEISRTKDMSTVLKGTGAVRHVFEHQNIVGPSVVEDFISVCSVRDVLEKRKDPQLSAFDCSIGTQDIVKETDEKISTTSDKRMKFNKIAQNELLTPHQLAMKVMSLTKSEKQALLNRYQKRLLPVVKESVFASKKFKAPSSNTNLASPRCDVENSLTSPEEKKPHEPGALLKVEVRSHFPLVSREAEILVNSLFFNKKCGSTDAEGSASREPSDHPSITNMSRDSGSSSNPTVVDQETGCSLTALSILDSLFFSSGEKIPSPQKKCKNLEEQTSNTKFQPAPFSSGALSLLNNSLLVDICNEKPAKK